RQRARTRRARSLGTRPVRRAAPHGRVQGRALGRAGEGAAEARPALAAGPRTGHAGHAAARVHGHPGSADRRRERQDPQDDERLAELQLQVLWEEILKRDLEIDVVGPPVRAYSNFLRGVKSLTVRIVT